MKTLMKKLEDMMVAITFAEAGEYETAVEMVEGAPGGEDEALASEAVETA